VHGEIKQVINTFPEDEASVKTVKQEKFGYARNWILWNTDRLLPVQDVTCCGVLGVHPMSPDPYEPTWQHCNVTVGVL